MEDQIVLAMASNYNQKYYFNNEFDQLPNHIKDSLKIICVTHTTDVGGILTLQFNETTGNLLIEASADEEDILYDEIGSHLKVKQMMIEHRELWESLETFFKVFYLGDEI